MGYVFVRVRVCVCLRARDASYSSPSHVRACGVMCSLRRGHLAEGLQDRSHSGHLGDVGVCVNVVRVKMTAGERAHSIGTTLCCSSLRTAVF